MTLPAGQPLQSEGDGAGAAEPEDASKPRRRKRRRRRMVRLGKSGISASDCAFVLVVLGAILPLGSVHVPVLLTVSALAMVAALLAVLGSGLGRGVLAPVAMVTGALALYCAFQALPLPFGWVLRLSPVAADVWARALHPFGEAPPQMASLSLDPGASWVEAVKWWTYASVIVAGATFGARHGAKWGAVVILGCALVVAMSTLGHGMVDATKVFGLYTPTVPRRGFRLGPLINSNTLASYLNVGVFAGIGLVATTRPPIPRWILAIGTAVVLAVSVGTGSRGGVVALIIGFLVLYPLLRQSRSVEGRLSPEVRRRIFFAVVVTVVAGAAMAAIAVSRSTLHLLLDDNLQKLKIATWVPPMVRDYSWFGIGRGAFESVFPAYKTADSNTVYSHPENFLVQWTTEWGVPVAVLLVVALVWLLRPNAWGAGRGAAASGMFVGVLVLAAQNIVDLGLEVPGVAILACAAIGAAWGGQSATRAVPANRWVQIAVAAMIPIVGVPMLAPAAIRGSKTVSSDKAKARSLFPRNLGDRNGVSAFKGFLHASMERHPAEPYFARLGATFTLWSGDGNPVPWIQRGLERAMTSGRMHYLLARLLGRHHIVSQALLELRLAVENDPELYGRAARYAVRLTRQYENLMRAVPEGELGTSMLIAFSSHLSTTDETASNRFLEEAIVRNPGGRYARVTMAKRLLRALNDRRFGTRCAAERRAACERAVLQHIRALARANPQSDEPLELAARLLLSAHRPNEATRLLATSCPTLRSRKACVNVWLEASAQADDRSELTRAIKFAERDSCTTPKSCATMYFSIGDILSRAQGPTVALAYYRRAVAEEPSRAGWLKVASVAAAIGAHGEASNALERASAFGGGMDLEKKRELERSRAMRDALKLQ